MKRESLQSHHYWQSVMFVLLAYDVMKFVIFHPSHPNSKSSRHIMNTYIQPIIATEKFSRQHWPALFACSWIGHYLFAFLAFQFNAGLAHCRALSRHKFEKKPISYFNKNNARSHLPLFCMSENNSSRNSLRFGLSSISYN